MMWAKTIMYMWVIGALLLVTQSSAQRPCRQYRTVGEALKENDLPAGLFPNNVQSFSCDPVGNALNLVIRLRSGCTVTREAVGVTNAVEAQPLISAVLSYRRLTNVRGFTVRLTAVPPLGPFNLRVPVAEVRVTQILGSSTKFVQFYSDAGIVSPPFLFTLFPAVPPNCDRHAMEDSSIGHQAMEDDHIPQAINDKDGNNQDYIPNYGRRLAPLLVA